MSEALMRTINDLETLKQEKSKSEAALGETTRARDRDNSNYQARIADLEAEVEVSMVKKLYCNTSMVSQSAGLMSN